MIVQNIFVSVEGETTLGGPLQWTTFVRFKGCNLRCWKDSGGCDAPEALDGRVEYACEEQTPEKFASHIVWGMKIGHYPKRLTLTGGEPLLQEEDLLEFVHLVREDVLGPVEVCLETNGSVPLSEVVCKVMDCIIMDLKPPSSGESEHVCWENLQRLEPEDFVKVVVSTVEDLEWAAKAWWVNAPLWNDRNVQAPGWSIGAKMESSIMSSKDQPLWATAYTGLTPQQIADWIRQHGMWKWRLNLQCHRWLWPWETEGV